ncbi:MAG: phosphotransferase, partial [Gammaproteobacteria bacterium]|nr:phosphotransferase [Gammaproteobacteria bacterium]
NRGTEWWINTAKKVLPMLNNNEIEILETEITYQQQHDTSNLPKGIIHADMFRDNIMFTGNKLTGIIDFYYACNDILLYDIAVTVNDWCNNEAGCLDEDKTLAFIRAYHEKRSLTETEHAMWPVMLRAGALRFWLSRLQDKYFPRDGELTHIKDPDVFKNILLYHRNHETLILRLWP